MVKLFDLEESGYFYTRLQNSTNDAVANKILSLERESCSHPYLIRKSCQFFYSICQAGDHIVSVITIYGGTFNLFSVTLKKLGIDCTFIDQDASEEEIRKAFQPNTKLLFGETISNPGVMILVIKKFACIAHVEGVPLVIDNTFATTINCRPFE